MLNFSICYTVFLRRDWWFHINVRIIGHVTNFAVQKIGRQVHAAITVHIPCLWMQFNHSDHAKKLILCNVATHRPKNMLIYYWCERLCQWLSRCGPWRNFRGVQRPMPLSLVHMYSESPAAKRDSAAPMHNERYARCQISCKFACRFAGVNQTFFNASNKICHALKHNTTVMFLLFGVSQKSVYTLKLSANIIKISDEIVTALRSVFF